MVAGGIQFDNGDIFLYAYMSWAMAKPWGPHGLTNFLIPAATFPHLSPTRIYELSYREKLSILKPLTKVFKYFCY